MVASNIAVDHATTGLVRAEVERAQRISPHFVRVTLGGEALQNWRHLGFDQWFRLALPIAEETCFDRLSDRFDMRGYLKYLSLPKATRPVIRNYTVREFRAEQGEMDIDFVVHGTEGFAGNWAASLPIGSPVALLDQGCGFTLNPDADRVLLAGEESALPALLGVLRDLPAHTVGDAIIEIPDAADRQPAPGPAGVRQHWIVRPESARPGLLALDTLKQIATGGTAEPGQLSAFVVGEQQLASGGRKHLVNELGVPKSAVKFCGYWRQR